MNDSRGLTLKGSLVVIAALLVLAALGIFLLGGVREYANRAQCQSNLHSIGCALIQYAQDYGNLYPAVPGVVKATADAPGRAAPGDGRASLKLLEIPDEHIYWCPTTPPGPGEYSYAYDPRHRNTDPGGVAIMADKGGGAGKNSPNHPAKLAGLLPAGQNVLYVDCHADWKKTTNVGYENDEIFVRNDELREKDSWLIE